MGEKGKKRVLYYVPMVHASEEMLVELYEDFNSGNEHLYGIAGKMKNRIYWEIQDSVLKKYWDWVGKDLDDEMESYENAQIFCEAIYENGRKAENQIRSTKFKNDEWPTLQLCKKLIENGAKMEKTEKKSLYLDHARRLEKDLPDKRAMNRRDREIAKRINENLDETGILLVGAAHNPMRYLDKDIKVRKIMPFDAYREMENLQKRLDKKMEKKYAEFIDELEDIGKELI